MFASKLLDKGLYNVTYSRVGEVCHSKTLNMQHCQLDMCSCLTWVVKIIANLWAGTGGICNESLVVRNLHCHIFSNLHGLMRPSVNQLILIMITPLCLHNFLLIWEWMNRWYVISWCFLMKNTGMHPSSTKLCLVWLYLPELCNRNHSSQLKTSRSQVDFACGLLQSTENTSF